MNKKGFTLIEMLVVVAIIGLLSSVVVIGVGTARQNARDARRIADIRQIQSIVESYNLMHGSYPENLEATGTQVPTDPLTNAVYGYAATTLGDLYVTGACLERGMTGTGHVAWEPGESGVTLELKNLSEDGCACAGNDPVFCAVSG